MSSNFEFSFASPSSMSIFIRVGTQQQLMNVYWPFDRSKGRRIHGTLHVSNKHTTSWCLKSQFVPVLPIWPNLVTNGLLYSPLTPRWPAISDSMRITSASSVGSSPWDLVKRSYVSLSCIWTAENSCDKCRLGFFGSDGNSCRIACFHTARRSSGVVYRAREHSWRSISLSHWTKCLCQNLSRSWMLKALIGADPKRWPICWMPRDSTIVPLRVNWRESGEM